MKVAVTLSEEPLSFEEATSWIGRPLPDHKDPDYREWRARYAEYVVAKIDIFRALPQMAGDWLPVRGYWVESVLRWRDPSRGK